MLEPATELASRVFEELMGRGIGPREVETGFTPRRLVLVLRGLPEREPDREERWSARRRCRLRTARRPGRGGLRPRSA
jgi:glycyl-tRNA synthetase beta subunit